MTLFSPSHPVWSMAFRPLYLLAALYGALSILLWGFGYQGTDALPGFFWHAHEMIWGYAGAVVVAFLLTAVATWTGQPPVRGKTLMLLVALWLLARITAFLPTHLLSALSGTLFFWSAAFCMGCAVLKSKNTRNYPAVAALFLFGAAHACFHILLAASQTSLRYALIAGLMMVAAFIGLIGNRIISFFTARRLNTPQKHSPIWLINASLLLPIVAAVLLFFQAAKPAAIPALLAGAVGIRQTVYWFEKGILREPMLWTLHLGHALTASGMTVLGFSAWQPQWQSLGIHLIAVGGIGLLTVSMMTRTALGHTGRPLYPAPKGLTAAFGLMVAACLFRALAAVMLYHNATAYAHSLRVSAVLFALSLLIYFLRYLPWLTQAEQRNELKIVR